METNKLKIGLFGFGVVGQGFYQLAKLRASTTLEIIQIAVKNPTKVRSISINEFTFNYLELLHHPDLQLVVEAIDDEIAAYEIVKSALSRGISVVSANKKLLANHLQEFIEISNVTGAKLLYEAAAAAAIPIIGLLNSFFNSEPVLRIEGIVNGTTNYILTKMQQEQFSYSEALKEAQALGFAESNPASDVDGHDASYKLTLLSAHAFGKIFTPNKILRYGIRFITNADVQDVIQHQKVIKLLAIALETQEGLVAIVLPTILDATHKLASISAEFNAINLVVEDSGTHFLVGKGAGSMPTGASILKDIHRLDKNEYQYSKVNNSPFEINPKNYQIEIIISYVKSYNLEGFKEINKRKLENGRIQSKGWISLLELKQQIQLLESQEIGVFSTGEFRKSAHSENAIAQNQHATTLD